MSEGDANGGLRVLLVDDDTVLRQALAQRRTDPRGAVPSNRLPVLRGPEPGSSLVVWRRQR